MRFEQLAYLCEAAKAGSISAAAGKLHISQQSLNMTLKNLEKELGMSLFNTSRQGISLTAQGEIVVEYAKNILHTINEMKLALDDSMTAVQKPEAVSLQTPPLVLEFLIPHILQTIYDKYPNLSININVDGVLNTIEALVAQTIDLAILSIRYTLWEKLSLELPASQNLTFVPLYQYKLAICAAENHPLAKYKHAAMKTIIKYPFVFYERAPYENDVDYLWLKLYGEPQIKFTTLSAQIYRDILRSGKAIGFFPSVRHCGINIPLEKGVKLVTIKDEDAITTAGYLYNNAKPITPAMQKIIDELVTFCQ